ncbi:hypothetical protein TgHK011_004359 [Trichoderma gracile]|nr:hypothetical protein TgHK011_004359 [Trichoderma gracile]
MTGTRKDVVTPENLLLTRLDLWREDQPVESPASMLRRQPFELVNPERESMPGPQRRRLVGTGPAHSHRAHFVVDGGSRKGRENWERDQEKDEALATEQRRGAEERRLDGSPWPAIRMGLAGWFGSNWDANLSMSTRHQQGDSTASKPRKRENCQFRSCGRRALSGAVVEGCGGSRSAGGLDLKVITYGVTLKPQPPPLLPGFKPGVSFPQPST